MIYLGLDPGTQRCGYAVIEVKGSQPKILDIGVWILKTSQRQSLGLRLEEAANCLEGLLKKHNPRFVGVEKAVFFKNVVSSMVLSELRGVLRLVLYQNLDRMDVRLFELSPTAVKRMASGLGLASKLTVLKALKLRFHGLDQVENFTDLPYDAFDALAIAYTTWRESFKSQKLHTKFREGVSA